MGKSRLGFLSEAMEEVRAARIWYSERSAQAGLKFISELDAAVQAIEEAPLRWPAYRHGTRRYRLHRFPYFLVYRVANDRVEVVACQHAHRMPEYWYPRLP